MNRLPAPALLFAVAVAGCGAEAPLPTSPDEAPDGIRWTIEETRVRNEAGAGGKVVPITYHGGPIMYSGVNAYVIWYGNWAGNTGTTIVGNFLGALGGSGYWNINST